MKARPNAQRPHVPDMSNRRRRSAGSILVNTAIALSLIVITLIGTELGYMFYLKRELQKTADLAALAGAQGLGVNNCTTATAAAIANAARNMPVGLAPLGADGIVCGRWDPVLRPASPHFGTPDSGQKFNAVRVTISRTPALLLAGIPGNQARPITVDAMAAQQNPRANLTIRSTLLTVDSTQSPLLNAVFGGLLGGSLNIDAVGWNGLLNTNVKLLTYIDQLGVDLGIGVGKYDQVLSTNVSVGTLIQAMIDALQQGGNTAQVAIDALNLIKLTATAGATQPLLKLGDLLGVQTGTDASALNTDIQLFQLLEGVVQAANGKNGVVATIALPATGPLPITANIKVIEPPQVSATGNPALAKINPTGPDQIYVRTAQIRTLISIDLGASGQLLTGLISGLSDALSKLGSALISILTTVIDLTPPGDCPVISFGCHTTPKSVISDVTPLPLPIRIDVNIDVAPAAAYVTDFDCTNDADKKLWAASKSNIATLRIGKMGSSSADAKAKVFSSLTTPPTVDPIALVDVGTVQSRKTCTAVVLGLCVFGSPEYLQANGTWTTQISNAQRTAFGGGGVGLSVNPDPISGGAATLPFHSSAPGLLKELTDTSAPAQTYLSTSATGNVAGLLIDTINGLQLNLYKPGASTGVLGAILQTTDAAATAVFGLLKNLVAPLLASIINPLVETLLKGLGIDLANAQVGARLTCRSGAELVY